MMWVLIVMHLQYTSSDFISMQEFNSKESCEVAAKFVKIHAPDLSRFPNRVYTPFTIECVQK